MVPNSQSILIREQPILVPYGNYLECNYILRIVLLYTAEEYQTVGSENGCFADSHCSSVRLSIVSMDLPLEIQTTLPPKTPRRRFLDHRSRPNSDQVKAAQIIRL